MYCPIGTGQLDEGEHSFALSHVNRVWSSLLLGVLDGGAGVLDHVLALVAGEVFLEGSTVDTH
jgi:hypothetical protein